MRLPVLLIGLVLIGALAGLRLANPAPLSALRLAYFDTLQRLSPRVPVPVPVRVVDIDEASLSAHGQWPWPRDRLATLTRRLAEAGASAIAYDIIFAEPDRMSPARLVRIPELARILPESLPGSVLTAIDTDRAFAEAMATVPVVLGIARSGLTDDATAMPKARVTLVGADAEASLPDLGPATSLVPILAKAAAGIGAISVGPGANGAVARTLPLLWTTPDGPVPSLALETLRVALGEDGLVLWESRRVAGTIDRISVGAYDIPTTPDGQLWLRAREEDQGKYIPAHRLLDDSPLPDLRGVIVLVGTSAAGLLDLRTTALGETIPGVAVHAQAIEQILSGQHLVRSDFASGIELLLFVSAGLLVAGAMSRAGPAPSSLVGSGAAFAIAATSWTSFATNGLLIDATFPLIGTFLTFSLLTLYRLFVTDRDARLIRRSFSHYVAAEVLKEIETGGHEVGLGGRDQIVTVMFSDIRNFTQLSETLDAQGIVALLNRHFGGLTDAVIRYRGTIDKFMGDSVMAFWNAPVPAPDHAELACRAALDMRAALHRINAAGDGSAIRMGIGIATGMACIGNIGSRDRFNYTAIGETVNSAARLEAASRHVDFDILASGSVRDAAGGMAWLGAGALEAKGVSGRIEAAILLGDDTLAADPAFRDLSHAHAELTHALTTGQDPGAALARTRALAGGFPELAPFYDRIAARAGDFARLSRDAGEDV